MKKILAVVLFLLLTGLAHAETVVDITELAGKNEKEVAEYLGNPFSHSENKYGPICKYVKGDVEIVFIQGKADWITVKGVDQIPFSKAALGALGLKEIKPSFANEFVMRWDSIQGLREVSLFKGGVTSDYAYIKVKTK